MPLETGTLRTGIGVGPQQACHEVFSSTMTLAKTGSRGLGDMKQGSDKDKKIIIFSANSVRIKSRSDCTCLCGKKQI